MSDRQVLGTDMLDEMRGRRVRQARLHYFAASSVMALCVALGATGAQAQSSTIPPPPVHRSVDANGVDLITGAFGFADTLLSIGQQGAGGLAYVYYGIPRVDGYYGEISVNGSTYTATVGSRTWTFNYSGGIYTTTAGDGVTLGVPTSGAYSGCYVLTDRDGTVYGYCAGIYSPMPAYYYNTTPKSQLTSIARPNGEAISINVYNITFYSKKNPDLVVGNYTRIQSVTNNFGYMLHYSYQSDADSDQNSTKLASVTAINNAVDYCAPTAFSCSGLTVSWPTLTAAFATNAFTDSLGNTTTYPTPLKASATQTLTMPSGRTLTYVTDGAGRTTSVSNGVGTWSYAYSGSGTAQTTTVTDPDSHTRVAVSNPSADLLNSDTDGTSHTVSYSYDGYGRAQLITNPEGDTLNYTYDGRGNVTQLLTTGTDHSSTITLNANYDATCSAPAKCNQPNWTKDGRGAETDYSYNTTTGQVTSIIRPAGANGLRPETDFGYQSLYAYYKNSSGSIVAGPSPISMLATTMQCATAQTCAGSSSAVVATFNHVTSGASTNLLPNTLVKASGNGSLSASMTLQYDVIGNITSSTDPMNLVTAYFYDANRRLLGVISPAPGASLPNRATRYTYECDSSVKAGCEGLVTLAEVGTTPDQSGFSSFTSLVQSQTVYDSIDRVVGRQTTNLSTSTPTVVAYTQYSYDNANLTTCSTVRMNMSALGSSLPGSACWIGVQGTYGPDRITKFTYDNDNRVTGVQVAAGTSAQANAITHQYGADGELQNEADGKGNLTTYVPDAFNRVYRIEYPNPSGGGTSSTTDYEQYAYDANGNVTQDRRRDGTSITYSYDALNKLTSGYNGQTYGYDNLGQLTSAGYGGLSTNFQYDALGRQTSETNTYGITVSRQYDLDGRKTRLTYPDGYYINYAYYNTGELEAVGDPSGALLMYYTRDGLGRTTTIARNSSVSENLAYGNQLGLFTDAYSFGDTSKNNIFYYNYTPAGEIASTTTTNGSYSWSDSLSGTAYSTDGQNKYTAAGSFSLSYDARGNVQNYGGKGYVTDALNRMTTANSVGMTYDGPGRLVQTSSSSETTSYLYDGSQIIGEYSGGVMQNRYVPGEGQDNPVIWFTGTGTAISNAQWLLYNGKGSVAAVANSGGSSNTTTVINTYGPNGEAGNSNSGRFQYKGMPYLSDAGIYHVRVRDYLPGLGRFMQPDPIGYGDGMNFYNFAHNSGPNMSDPGGTDPAGAVIGGIFGAGEGVFTQIVGDGKVDIGADLGAAAVGGLQGAAIGFFNPSAGVAAAIGGVAGGGYDLTVQLIRNNGNLSKVNLWELGGATAGGVAGGLTGQWIGLKAAKLGVPGGYAPAVVFNEFALPFSIAPPIVGAKMEEESSDMTAPEIVVTVPHNKSNPTVVSVPHVTSVAGGGGVTNYNIDPGFDFFDFSGGGPVLQPQITIDLDGIY